MSDLFGEGCMCARVCGRGCALVTKDLQSRTKKKARGHGLAYSAIIDSKINMLSSLIDVVLLLFF